MHRRLLFHTMGLLLWALAGSLPARGEAWTGKVTGVDDVVTLRILREGRPMTVRLYGLGGPRQGQPHDARARQLTTTLALDKEVRVEEPTEESGAAGLGAANVVLPDGRSLGHELLKSGFAWWDSQAAPRDGILEELQEQARKGNMGLWSESGSGSPEANAPETGASAPSTSGDRGAEFFILRLVAALLAAAVGVLAWQVLRLRARRVGPAAGSPANPVNSLAAMAPGGEGSRAPATGSAPGLALVRGAIPAVASFSQADAEALEASRQVIQDLLRNLNEFVGGLVERNSSYVTKIESYKVSIQKAMTMAGLEQIERLLLQEISEMQAANAKYRQELDQANTRIQEQQEVMDRIQLDARLDYLTHIPNRRAIEERLGEEFARAQRYGKLFSLIMLDIDLFKRVNDTFGHVAGDKVLQVVSHVMEVTVRQTDCVGRYGGEEFVIVLPETPLARARLVAEKIRRAVEAAGLKHEKATIKVTLSAGVGEVRLESETPEAFVARVDAALYRAKQAGRNRVELAETGD